MEDRLISEREFAEMMGWKLSYARRLRYEGETPQFVQNGKGGKVRYWMSDVKDWIDERTQSNGEKPPANEDEATG